MINLDQTAARYAQAIIQQTQGADSSDVDNTVTKALGVLQEQGLYAYTLFLASRKKEEEKRALTILQETVNLLGEPPFSWPLSQQPNRENILEHIAGTVLNASLEQTLLAKDVCELMLIYARYGAKARGAAE